MSLDTSLTPPADHAAGVPSRARRVRGLRPVLAVLLLGLVLGIVLAACGTVADGGGTGATACERAVSAAAAVPAGDASPADLDGAIAVCDDWATLSAALEERPDALDGKDARVTVAGRCATDPSLALSAVCSTLSPGPSPTAPGPSPSVSEAPGDVARITFGTGLDPTRTAVTGAVSRIRTAYPKPIALVATLPQPVGAEALTVRAIRGSDPAGPAALERSLAVDPARSVIAAELDLARLLDRRAGTYLVQFVAGDRVVAQGSVELVD